MIYRPLACILAIAAAGAAEPVILNGFDAAPAFAYLSFQKGAAASGGILHLATKDGQGGAGYALSGDLSAQAARVPALWIRANPGNKAESLQIALFNEDKRRIDYLVRIPAPGADFVRVSPEDGMRLSDPVIDKDGHEVRLDLTRITQLQIVGNWRPTPIDVEIDRVELVDPAPAQDAARGKILSARAEAAAKKAAELERAQKARDAMLAAGAPHPADGPSVQHVCAVTPDTLSLSVQAGTYVPNVLAPYVAQPGDEIAPIAGKSGRIVVDGKVVTDPDRALFRLVDGKRTRVALVSPDGRHLFSESRMRGLALDESAVDSPRAYLVQSADDPAFATPVSPTAVFRKSKPDGANREAMPFAHSIALRLPAPLREGATYTIRLQGVNTAQAEVSYRHDPRSVRSTAIHAVQTGYRSDDPCKRAYLSTWLGGAAEDPALSGGYTHTATAFELVDAASGAVVFTGAPVLTKAQDAIERLNVHYEKDFTLTAVHRLDFSAFATPGTYRVRVPGLGVSDPFTIAADVWVKPFQTAMQGIVTQRQGIALGPPFSAFTRARAFHPDDGVQFYQLTVQEADGQEGTRGKNMEELAAAGKLERVQGVWGGYQDAGDWDTLGRHLDVTAMLFELYELAPQSLGRIRLSLPADEAGNAIPDLLDEAMWQLPCFLRLQMPDGGVRGGYGEGWGCREGQTSDMVRSAGVYAVDHPTTYRFAACGAMAARIMRPFDAALADTYLAAARRAWAWAEAHSGDSDPIFARQQARKGWPPFLPTVRRLRATAAVELLRTTGEAPFHDAFRQSTELAGEGPKLYLDQPEADFAYARLPADRADPALQRRAVQAFTTYADHAIAFSARNGFDLINGRRTDLPVVPALSYFSTPGVAGQNLIRAHVLTKDVKYLAAVVQSTNYSLGANPDNLVYCAGLGVRSCRFPFKVDANVSGQFPDRPVGYIPYGQGDEALPMCRSFNGWVYQWVLNHRSPRMFPDYYTWPANEVFIDFGINPQMNENTLDQTNAPAAYCWGYLAIRP